MRHAERDVGNGDVGEWDVWMLGCWEWGGTGNKLGSDEER